MKILIIRFSSLGDIVLTEPVVRLLNNQYPGCQIDYVTKPLYEQAVSFFDGISKIITADDIYQTIKQVRQNRYDLVIDLHGKLNSMLVSLASRSANKLRYNKKRRLRKRIVTNKTGSIGSTVALYLNAFDNFGKYAKAGLYNLDFLDIKEDFYPKIDVNSIKSQINTKKISYYSEIIADSKTKNKTTIGIFPGALHKTKQYPTEKFAELTKILPSEKYCYIVFGSPAEKHLGDELKDKSPADIINWCGEFGIAELILMMDKVDLIISNDSGPMHIAAALGKRQIAIFGATSTKFGFKPHNGRAVVLDRELSCRPCSLHGGAQCPQGHFKCMNDLNPEIIARAIERSVSGK